MRKIKNNHKRQKKRFYCRSTGRSNRITRNVYPVPIRGPGKTGILDSAPSTRRSFTHTRSLGFFAQLLLRCIRLFHICIRFEHVYGTLQRGGDSCCVTRLGVVRGTRWHRNDAFQDEDFWNENEAPPIRTRPCSTALRWNPCYRKVPRLIEWGRSRFSGSESHGNGISAGNVFLVAVSTLPILLFSLLSFSRFRLSLSISSHSSSSLKFSYIFS